MFNYFLLKFKNLQKFNLIHNIFFFNPKLIKFLLFLLSTLIGSYIYYQYLYYFCQKSSIFVGSFSLLDSIVLFFPEILIIIYILCSFINYLLKYSKLN